MRSRFVRYRAAKGIGRTPAFTIIEDTEHTARCVMAIRARRRREGMAQIVENRP